MLNLSTLHRVREPGAAGRRAGALQAPLSLALAAAALATAGAGAAAATTPAAGAGAATTPAAAACGAAETRRITCQTFPRDAPVQAPGGRTVGTASKGEHPVACQRAGGIGPPERATQQGVGRRACGLRQVGVGEHRLRPRGQQRAVRPGRALPRPPWQAARDESQRQRRWHAPEAASSRGARPADGARRPRGARRSRGARRPRGARRAGSRGPRWRRLRSRLDKRPLQPSAFDRARQGLPGRARRRS